MTAPPPQRLVPWRWKTLLILGLVVVALLLVVRLQAVFTPLLIAFLLTYIWNPIVTRMERWMPRVAAILVVYAGFFGIVTVGAIVALPALAGEAVQFVDEGFVGERILEDKNKDGVRDEGEPFEDRNENGRWDPPKFQKFVLWVEKRVETWLGTHGWRETYHEIAQRIRDRREKVMPALQEAAGTILKGAVSSIKGALVIASFLIFTPIYLFFLLKNMNRWWALFQKLIPYSYRDQTIRALTRIHNANAAFFRGQIMIASIEGGIVFVVLALLEVPMPLLFGVMYACLAIIPYVGVITVFSLTSIFLLASTGTLGGSFYGIIALFLGIQLLENLVLQPAILGKETGLHPMAIIIALFVFADLFGFLGILLAVPLASMTIILAQEYLMPILREGERSGDTASYSLPIGSEQRRS